MINKFEQLALNACPCQKTLVLDGWIVRISDGISKRTNSINPIFPMSDNLSDKQLLQKIQFCETLYASHHLPTVYKLTHSAYPAKLDTVLEKQGYAKIRETSFQVLDLTLLKLKKNKESRYQLLINPHFTDEWLEDFIRLSNHSEGKKLGYANIIGSIVLPTTFFTLRLADSSDNQAIACGLAVMESGFIGLFDLVVAETYRGQGIGRYLVNQILAYGQSQGCHTAYLQVEQQNSIAKHLYRQMGFVEQYEYWYRVQSQGI